MSRRNKDDGSGTVLQAVKTGKKTKNRTLEAVVFPKEGGRPVVVTVEPDEDGLFKINKDHPGQYKVTRGSVWETAGKLYAIVNEGNPQTVNAYTLTGDDSFDPVALNGIASNNFWEQLDRINKRKSPWRQASTWGLFAIGILVILVLVWQVRTTGSGLEELRTAIENMNVGGGGGGETAGGGDGSGHQDIAPPGGG